MYRFAIVEEEAVPCAAIIRTDLCFRMSRADFMSPVPGLRVPQTRMQSAGTLKIS